MSVQLLKRKFTVEEYNLMAEAGLFKESDRLELIAGEIIEMSPVGMRHAACVRRLDTLLNLKLAGRAIVDTQNPVVLNNTSEPEPDVALLKLRGDFYGTAHPRPVDCFLLVEVADSTIDYDRQIKIPLYAANGIAEVWLVDLNGETVEVYRQPGPSGYQSLGRFIRGQTLTVAAFANLSLTVDEVLG